MSGLAKIEINGTRYLSAGDVVANIGVSRQTLWRWRQQGLIPSGHRHRGRRVLFTEDELEEIRQFADKIEPIDHAGPKQLKLFHRKRSD